MGFPIRRTAGRMVLIGAMLSGGLLYAGISQAQDAAMQGERDLELAAAAGGPAPSAHLIAYEADKAAVEARDDDVAAAAQPGADAARAQAASPGHAAAAEARRPIAPAASATGALDRP